MSKPYEFYQYPFRLVVLLKNWFILSYRPLFLGLKSGDSKNYPHIFNALMPFLNRYLAIGVTVFLVACYRSKIFSDPLRTLSIISTLLVVQLIFPSIYDPIVSATINALLMLRVGKAIHSFFYSRNRWKVSNILNYPLGNESVLLSSLVLAFSIISNAWMPTLILGAMQSINLIFKVSSKIYAYFFLDKNTPDKTTTNNDAVIIKETENFNHVLTLLNDTNNDYLLARNNNTFLKYAAKLGSGMFQDSCRMMQDEDHPATEY